MEIAMVVFGLAAFGCLIAGGITLGRIVDYLRERGVSANYWSIRWMFPRYLARYRQLTLEETGTVGPLHAISGTFFALAGVFAICVLALFLL